MVNLRCPVCAGALEKRAGAYLCPKNHSFDIAKSGYVNLLLNSSQGHHGDDKLMVRARRDFLDKGYYDRFIAAVADAAAEFTPPEATVLDAGCGEGIYSLAVLRAIEKAGKHGELLGVEKGNLKYFSFTPNTVSFDQAEFFEKQLADFGAEPAVKSSDRTVWTTLVKTNEKAGVFVINLFNRDAETTLEINVGDKIVEKKVRVKANTVSFVEAE